MRMFAGWTACYCDGLCHALGTHYGIECPLMDGLVVQGRYTISVIGQIVRYARCHWCRVTTFSGGSTPATSLRAETKVASRVAITCRCAIPLQSFDHRHWPTGGPSIRGRAAQRLEAERKAGYMAYQALRKLLIRIRRSLERQAVQAWHAWSGARPRVSAAEYSTPCSLSHNFSKSG